MRVIRTAAGMQQLSQSWRRKGIRIGFVPTMGYLHEGHMSLVRRARQSAGRRAKVVVSIYVNPTQFGPREDLSKYPRDFARDAALCRREGVDAIFAPDNREMYPVEHGPFSTYVLEESLSKVMEGASRPTHFRGVTTVVAKLFNIVLPDVAIFGAKDYQQATIVRRMVRDLNFPLKLVVAPTCRHADGLAMSSRNKYLAGDLRQQAVVLWQALQRADALVTAARSALPSNRLKAQVKTLIERQPAARVDYIEFFDPDTLQPVRSAKPGTHMALAVFIGNTRLIDNGRLGALR